jgi:hypothetical protein
LPFNIANKGINGLLMMVEHGRRLATGRAEPAARPADADVSEHAVDFRERRVPLLLEISDEPPALRCCVQFLIDVPL